MAELAYKFYFSHSTQVGENLKGNSHSMCYLTFNQIDLSLWQRYKNNVKVTNKLIESI